MKYELDLDDDDIDFEGVIKIICSNDEDFVYLTILDNGPGYPEKMINQLYQSPNKVNHQNRRGMGSIIIYSYLKLHSGNAKIENRAEGGGKVTFSFPLVRSADFSAKS
jgi:sensor histidine kinase regulating citrate/malate metabolism